MVYCDPQLVSFVDLYDNVRPCLLYHQLVHRHIRFPMPPGQISHHIASVFVCRIFSAVSRSLYSSLYIEMPSDTGHTECKSICNFYSGYLEILYHTAYQKIRPWHLNRENRGQTLTQPSPDIIERMRRDSTES